MPNNNILTLDSLREDIEREFAPCQVDLGEGKTLTLRNLLRLPKNTREQVYTLLDELSDIQKDDDQDGLVATEQSAQIALKILPLVADNEKLGAKLVESIEDDLALTLRVFSRWMEGTQAGEAEGSPTS